MKYTFYLVRTALIALIICLTQMHLSVYAQDITNTIGANGAFIIKDGSTTFMSLNQTSGYLELNKSLSLPNTTSSTIGVIYKGTDRFIHDFKVPETTGRNLFVGNNSGNFTMSSGGNSWDASNNTAVGNTTLSSLTTGCRNSAFGLFSLKANTSGSSNNAFGFCSLENNTWGSDNCAFGDFSLGKNTTGCKNSAFGYISLWENTTGEFNSAFGYSSLWKNTSGLHNSAFGFKSLMNNTTGGYNSAFGTSSLSTNTGGGYNSAFGYESLAKNNANENSAFGCQSLYKNTTGIENSGFGSYTLYNNISSNHNSAFGYKALYNNTSADNSAFGAGALWANTTGVRNSAVGFEALHDNTAGNYNSALGYHAGFILTTGSNNTIIGYDAQPSSSTVNDEITLGNSAVRTLRCQQTAITSLSDMRDKKNIMDLPLGLDFLMSIKPRQFNWDRRDWYKDGNTDGSKMQETPTAGFIAQELDEAQTKANAEWLNLVLKSNPNKFEATPGNLLPVIVKSIQELKNENNELRAVNSQLKGELAELRTTVDEQIKQKIKNVLLKAMLSSESVEKPGEVSFNERQLQNEVGK